MAKVLVLYYSSYGHIERMAGAIADGARSAGAEVDIKRVPETVPDAVAKASHFKLDQPAPVATVADDVHPSDDPPGDQLSDAGRDVGPAHAQQLADLAGVERLRRHEQQGVDLGHRPVDAPGLAHLAPVEHELLRSGSEFHGRFRHVWPDSLYRKNTQRTNDWQVWPIQQR